MNLEFDKEKYAIHKLCSAAEASGLAGDGL